MTKVLFGIAAVLATTTTATAQITANDLVVLQVGDKSASTGQAVTLLDYAIGSYAAPVQSIIVPSTGANQAVVTGNSTAGGMLSANPNGTITFGAYRGGVGTVVPGTSATVNKVIGSLDVSTGLVNTNVGLSAAYNSLTFRSVATADGVNFYTSGANGGTGAQQLVNIPGGLPNTVTQIATSTLLTNSSSNNARQIQVVGGNLFLSAGATTPGVSVFQIGTGTPTTGGQALTQSISGLSSATVQYNSFAFARLGTGTSWNNTGFDTIYAVNNVNAGASAVHKLSFNGTSWSNVGIITLTGVNDITLDGRVGGAVDLYVTTLQSSSSTIATLSDTSGFAGAFAGSFNTLVTASGTTGFLGIAIAPPVPEPACLLAIGTFALAFVRRRLA